MYMLFSLATREEWENAKPSYIGALPNNLVEQEIHYFTDQHERTNGVLITGVGPLNAALAFGKSLQYIKKNTTVVNVGLAGSFNLDKAPLCSHWRITKEVYPEYGLVTADNVDAEALGFPQWRTPSNVVWDSIVLPELLTLNSLLRHCPIQGNATAMTVAGVTCCPERAARLAMPYSGPLLENMEGFALALACARHGVPFLEIRTVSNLVGTRDPESRAFKGALAAMRPVVEHLLS